MWCRRYVIHLGYLLPYMYYCFQVWLGGSVCQGEGVKVTHDTELKVGYLVVNVNISVSC